MAALSSSAAAVKQHRPAVAAAEASMLTRRWREFTTSGEPVRFLCFDRDQGRWVDVDAGVAEQLRQAFRERRALAEVVCGGRPFLFDFLRMARIDGATADQAALAWIDDRGACHFPPPDAAGAAGSRKRARDDDDAESSSGVDSRGGSAEEKTNTKKQKARWASAPALRESDRNYELVSKLFLSRGMGARGAEVTAVRRVPREPRFAEFEREGHLLLSKRGEAVAAPRFAWYGAPVEDLADVVEKGVAKTNAAILGAHAHGDGVHLAPAQCPYASALLAKADESGESHVVLCRVPMGRPEVVPAGSSQSEPSSDAYDSAVDNTVSPRWYVVWGKDMNKRILPEFVISFKCPNLHARGSSEATSKMQRSSPPRDMFPKLLAELEKLVPHHKCQTLQESYDCFKKGQVRKDQFTQFLRNYVGDNVLTIVAKKLRGY